MQKQSIRHVLGQNDSCVVREKTGRGQNTQGLPGGHGKPFELEASCEKLSYLGNILEVELIGLAKGQIWDGEESTYNTNGVGMGSRCAYHCVYVFLCDICLYVCVYYPQNV